MKIGDDGLLSLPKGSRDSNFELLRIVAMLMVLAAHVNFVSLGEPGSAEFMAHPVSSFFRSFWQSACMVSVNAFVLISGWYGIHTSRQGVMKFLFMLIFWRLALGIPGALGCFSLIGGVTPDKFTALINLMPGVGDWFSVSYLLLLFLAPLFNTYAAGMSLRRLAVFVALYLIFEIYAGWTLPVSDQFNDGYTALTIFGTYMLGALLRRAYGYFKSESRMTWCLAFILLTLISVWGYRAYTLTGIWTLSRLWPSAHNLFQSLISPVIIISSVALFLTFAKMRFHSRLINRIAMSTFAVYIIHVNPYIFGIYTKIGATLYDSLPLWVYACAIVGYVVGVFIICVLLDNIRLFLWQKIVHKLTIPAQK